MRENTFTHDDQLYDLNIIHKEVIGLPRNRFKVKDLIWLLDECGWTKDDAKRYPNMSKPIFVVKWQDKICCVDGYHRIVRAAQKGIKYLTGIWVPDYIMKKGKISNA